MQDLRVTQLAPDAGMVDFGIGQPAFDLLPLELLREAAARRLAEGDREFLNYGYEMGDGPFRALLAAFLGREGGYETTAGRLMITGGASQALDMICTHFARAGDTVFVEEPTYFLALRIFADRGLRAVPVPTSAEGVDLDALERLLAQERVAFFYTVPTFQNPSGATMPAEKRERLAQMAARHDFYVVADEVYHLLDYEGAPPPPLANFNQDERVLSLGSFSKILAPGLRLGWIDASPTLLQRMAGSGLLDSGGGLNPFTSTIVRSILQEEELAPHIARLKAVYRRRIACMDGALQRQFADHIHYAKPDGGFFFWVTLPESVDTAALLPAARQMGVAYQPGSKFSADDGCRNCMRLSFTFYDEAQLENGVARLAELVRTD